MTKPIPLKFGVSQTFPCSYLDDQQERLLVAMDDIVFNGANYEQLLKVGFRRSGEQVYRPYCVGCQSCESLRIIVNKFKPSRSQKRVLKRNQKFEALLVPNDTNVKSYFPMYARYIAARHRDGSMYPPDYEQYNNFVKAEWLQVGFLEIYEQDRLIGVSVLDILPTALSAVYTFFEPEYHQDSLGTFAILKAVEFAKSLKLQHVYLGYQIDQCNKMNYKSKFTPHERLIDSIWVEQD
ncbi:arginyltransferase [Saccharobesus litoralis]|uniref:Aspartate/glutamate leucyltransferase n=1 Tax=Saccharobesus litoralis TaxID=2172099 RepID=A0A2S0VTS2_9ALTE|nr:arginyltransferase [Saccharobesus litoralis]AWB67611.1 arginyltransferase [Saccharobesus litoralis]